MNNAVFQCQTTDHAHEKGGEEMEIIIKGEAKEIAALLREIAERQEDKEAVVEGISQSLQSALESMRKKNTFRW